MTPTHASNIHLYENGVQYLRFEKNEWSNDFLNDVSTLITLLCLC